MTAWILGNSRRRIYSAVMRHLAVFLVVALAAAACSTSDAAERSVGATNESTTTEATVDTTALTTTSDEGNEKQSPEEQARADAYLEQLSAPELGSGLPAVSRSYDIKVADLNGDGRDDIIFTTHQNRKISADSWDGFWVWTPTGYELIFLLPTLSDRHGCTAGDVNGDGATDVYCQLGAFKGSGTLKSNELWIQTAPGSFENQAAAWGVDDPSGRGRWPVMLDYDSDGLLDLYVTNQGDRSDDLRSENLLLRNVGGSFEEVVTEATGDLGMRCLNAVDFTGDGWVDLALCDSAGNPVFLQNDEGKGFANVSDKMYEGRRGWKDMAFGDLNQDGALDLVLVGPKMAQIRLNHGPDKWFTEVSDTAALGDYGWSLAIGDFYGDENLDVYLVQQGEDCTDIASSELNGADILLVGPDWSRRTLSAHQLGCGDEALPLEDGLVLVSNGSKLSRGPLQIRDLRTELPPEE
jgi:hypothetical protein